MGHPANVAGWGALETGRRQFVHVGGGGFLHPARQPLLHRAAAPSPTRQRRLLAERRKKPMSFRKILAIEGRQCVLMASATSFRPTASKRR